VFVRDIPFYRTRRAHHSKSVKLRSCPGVLRFDSSFSRFLVRIPPLSRCRPSDAVWHNPKLDFSWAVFTRLLLTHILRLLAGTCNGHEHRSPLRSSHASLLEPARRKGNLDAKNRDCTAESGRTSVDTESLSCGAALLWGALDKDRATMAHQCSFDGGVMLVREFWSEFSRTVFRIRR
jgi:hypothetical protein